MRKNLEIELDNVALSRPCLEILAEVVARNITIRSLRLPRNSIDETGLHLLATALAKNRSLEELDLAKNDVKDKGLAILAASIPKCPGLRALGLSGNSIGDTGVASLCHALCSSSEQLQSIHEFPCLDLSTNLISDKVSCCPFRPLSVFHLFPVFDRALERLPSLFAPIRVCGSFG
jgi:Ran GTPase-activating protein (RanGAP) involved in mRNA processing and transport